jgi:hypothetical protein
MLENNCPNIKVDGLVAGVIQIPSSTGIVNDQIRRRRICKFLQSVGSCVFAALANKKLKNFDQTYTPIA